MSNDASDLVPPEADEILLLALYRPNSVTSLIYQWRKKGVLDTRNLPIGGAILRALIEAQPTSLREARRAASVVMAQYTDLGHDYNAGSGVVSGLAALEFLTVTGHVNTGRIGPAVTELLKRSKRLVEHTDPKEVRACLEQITGGKTANRKKPPPPKPPAPSAQRPSPPKESAVPPKLNGKPSGPAGHDEPVRWQAPEGRPIMTIRLGQELRKVLAGRPITDLYLHMPWLKAAAETELTPGDTLGALERAGIDALRVIEALPMAKGASPWAGRQQVIGTLGNLFRPLYDRIAPARRLAGLVYSQLRNARLLTNGALDRDQLNVVIGVLRAHAEDTK